MYETMNRRYFKTVCIIQRWFSFCSENDLNLDLRIGAKFLSIWSSRSNCEYFSTNIIRSTLSAVLALSNRIKSGDHFFIVSS